MPSVRVESAAGLEALRDSAPKEHVAVVAAQRLSRLPPAALPLVSAFWRRVARWPAARRQMPATLNNLTYERRWMPLVLARLVLLAAAPRSAAGTLLGLGIAATWLVRRMGAPLCIKLRMPRFW